MADTALHLRIIIEVITMATSAIPKIKLVVAVITLCLTISAPAQSQSLLLEEVVVTAQKREQNVNEIGMAISAF